MGANISFYLIAHFILLFSSDVVFAQVRFMLNGYLTRVTNPICRYGVCSLEKYCSK